MLAGSSGGYVPCCWLAALLRNCLLAARLLPCLSALPGLQVIASLMPFRFFLVFARA